MKHNLIRNKGNIYATLILFIGVLTLIPLIIIPFYPEDSQYFMAFFLPGILCIVTGLLFYHKKDSTEKNISEWQSPLQKGSLPVLFAWFFGFCIGALPFIIAQQLTPLHALFESVSGWTTTGLTVADVTVLPHIFLFHRSFMQYCGGLGFLLMMAMLIKGKQSVNLYNAEGHPDKLMPNLKRTARTIFILYNSFLIIGTALYRLLGMSVFDAVCHTMSALSTAGFTTQAQSIGAYNSLSIEAITIILMLIGSTNFAVLLMLCQGRFRQVSRVSELRFLGILLTIFVTLSGVWLWKETSASFWRSIWNALFGVVTTFTTTGYATMDYAGWPQFSLGLLILLMLIGGSIGSTAGGIKLIRVYLLLKISWNDVRSRLSPVRKIKVMNYYRAQGKMTIDHRLIQDTIGFVTSYMFIVIFGSLLITASAGCSFFDAFFEFSSAFGTVGISNGITSPDASSLTLIIEIIAMLLGRLEIFIVCIGIYALAKTVRKKTHRCAATAYNILIKPIIKR